MEQNVQTWSHTTGKIFNSVLIFSIGAIAAGLTAGLAYLVPAGTLFSILAWICEIAVIAGYILYIIALGNLRNLVGEKEGTALGQIRTAAIITIVTALLAALHTPGWIVGIMNFAAFVMMLVGFNTLKKSPIMPERAKTGFTQLFISMLLAIIAAALSVVFGWIPLLGFVIGVVAGALNIAAFVMVITGWGAVKSSPAPIA